MSDIDAHSALQERMAGFASPTTRMLLAGNGLTSPVIQTIGCITVAVRELARQPSPVAATPVASHGITAAPARG